jgi:hypothetical protein
MDKINQLIKLSVEIEGLLRVIEAQEGTEVAVAEELLQEKYAQFGDILYDRYQEPEENAQEPVNEEVSQEVVATTEEEAEVPAVEEEAPAEEVAEESQEDADEELTDELETVEEEIQEEPIEEPQEEPVEEAEEEPVSEPEPELEAEVEQEEQPQQEPESVEVVEPTAIHGIDDENQELAEETKIESEPEEVTTLDEEPEETVVEMHHADPEQLKRFDEDGIADDLGVIRVDEMLARQGSKDLKKAFTLNDKFRFRRELFGNSNTEMSEAIDMVSAMVTYDEATDYFYNDLGWDANDEHVKDFMTIIANHFDTK